MSRAMQEPWPGRNSARADETMVQISIRVPFWYREKIAALNKRKSIASNVVDLIAERIPQERGVPRMTDTGVVEYNELVSE